MSWRRISRDVDDSDRLNLSDVTRQDANAGAGNEIPNPDRAIVGTAEEELDAGGRRFVDVDWLGGLVESEVVARRLVAIVRRPDL